MNEPKIRNLLLVYQSAKEFDVKFGKVGDIIDQLDFRKMVADSAHIWEYVNESDRINNGFKRKRDAKGAWFFALKWDGTSFRVLAIAVTPDLKEKAYHYIKHCIHHNTKLSILDEYSFTIHQGNLIQNDTQLIY